MSYLKINGEDTKYNVSLSPFTTQHGKRAVRFIGDEIPTTSKGFKYYNDDDELIVDMSAYVYQYRQNEYTMEQDEIVMPLPNDDPVEPSVLDRMNARINRVSSQVYAITPYTDSKTGYYGEIEKVFYNVPNGDISVFFDNYDGEYTMAWDGGRLTISFPERLTDTTNINIMVQ